MRAIDLSAKLLAAFSDVMCHGQIEAADMDDDSLKWRPPSTVAWHCSTTKANGSGKPSTGCRDSILAISIPSPGWNWLWPMAARGPSSPSSTEEENGSGREAFKDDRRVFLRASFRVADLDVDGRQENPLRCATTIGALPPH